MSERWSRVRLGEVLWRSTDTAEILPDTEYQEITVKLWGKGVVQRGTVAGAEIAGSRRFVARRGQFILSRIDARNGALGIVPPELCGAVVTNDFPLFNLDAERLDSSFLGWLSRTHGFVELCLRASEGTTNRVRLKEERFLALEVHLPPLAEQRRIVGRIEELAARIAEVQALRQGVVEEGDALLRSILAADTDAVPTPMSNLVRLRQPDVIVQPGEQYQFAGVYSFGRGVFRTQCRSGMEFSYPRLTRLRVGDFVYPKLMAWEGALGVTPAECDGCVVSTEFPVFEIDRSQVLPEVLDVFFRSPTVWPELSGASTGTNVRRKRLNPGDFLRYEMPLPRWETQLRLQTVSERISEIRQQQDNTAAELDSLLPASLDRAFRGEL